MFQKQTLNIHDLVRMRAGIYYLVEREDNTAVLSAGRMDQAKKLWLIHMTEAGLEFMAVETASNKHWQ